MKVRDDQRHPTHRQRLYDLAVRTLGHDEHLGDVVNRYGTGVDIEVIRRWWSLRSACGGPLIQHGF